MSHTIDAARAVVEEYATGRATSFSPDVIDRGSYWFFPVGYAGSCGVIVEKADLRLFPMGSSLSLDDCFWGHEHGFSPDFVILRILDVRDREAAEAFLLPLVREPAGPNPNPRRVWLRASLLNVPFDFAPQSLWLHIPRFRALKPAQPFEYRVLPAR